MFQRKSTDEGSNFWISYADLMAGLLFVFILLIGAIVVKSIVLKSDLHRQQTRLETLSKRLEEKEAVLARLARDLETSRARLQATVRSLGDKDAVLAAQRRTIAAQEKEIADLKAKLRLASARNTELAGRIASLTQARDELNATLQKAYETSKARTALLSTRVQELNASLAEKENALKHLSRQLDESRHDYADLLAALRSQRERIKALTGIRLKVIAALKARLGDKLTVDKHSGALRLSSKILFDKGSAVLKEEAKAALKRSFEEYVRALLEDPRIAPHLDKIVIEGHTDSDGDFLYNLALSQKRALSVMNYLLGLDVTKRYRLTPKLEASGRAYLDAVYDDNGIEDKEASRRIEIKFRLKNDEAMEEIERILDAGA